ncbi:MAG: hydrogenase maturation nickel metallochaperone HypA [Synechococcaceae bacterium WB8_1B_136]|nr:hydrogenase maturation nickel metallochaperone HypA [Synechococcaceae bacterium WB8_1B_136]
MHELALMAELRHLAEEAASREGASRIHRLQLRIGSLSGVDADALRSAFAVVMADREPGDGSGSIDTQGSTLELEVVRTVCFCADCQQEFAPSDVIHACPRCGALSTQVLRGRELELVALEVS